MHHPDVLVRINQHLHPKFSSAKEKHLQLYFQIMHDDCPKVQSTSFLHMVHFQSQKVHWSDLKSPSIPLFLQTVSHSQIRPEALFLPKYVLEKPALKIMFVSYCLLLSFYLTRFDLFTYVNLFSYTEKYRFNKVSPLLDNSY